MSKNREPLDLTGRTHLTVDETCRAIGRNRSTVMRMINAGQIPAFQPGGPKSRWMIPIEALRTLGMAA